MSTPYPLMGSSSHTPEDFLYFVKNVFRNQLYPYDKSKTYLQNDIILRWFGVTSGRFELLIARKNGITGPFNPNDWNRVSRTQLERLLSIQTTMNPDNPSLHGNEPLGHLGPSTI